MRRPPPSALAVLAAVTLTVSACAAADDDHLTDAQIVAEDIDADPGGEVNARAGHEPDDGQDPGAPAVVTLDDVTATDGTWQIGEAGTLAFRAGAGDELVLVDATAAPGWEVEVDDEGRRELEVVYRSAGRRYVVEVERKGRDLEIDVVLLIDGAEPGTFPLGGAGSVDLATAGGALERVELRVAEGWTLHKEDLDDDEIEIELRRGDVRWRIEAELDDGELTVSIALRVKGRHPA